MIKYYNLDKENNFILCEDKKYNAAFLYSEFMNTIVDKGYVVEKFEKSSQSKYILRLNRNGDITNIVLFIKNITGAGWSDKPKIKRSQVSNVMDTFKNYSSKEDKFIFMIIGYYNFDDNPIYVGWDAYRYINHNTIRSCYVSVDSLKRGYEKKYYVGVDSAQKVWIFTPENVDKFFEQYKLYLRDRGGNF